MTKTKIKKTQYGLALDILDSLNIPYDFNSFGPYYPSKSNYQVCKNIYAEDGAKIIEQYSPLSVIEIQHEDTITNLWFTPKDGDFIAMTHLSQEERRPYNYGL